MGTNCLTRKAFPSTYLLLRQVFFHCQAEHVFQQLRVLLHQQHYTFCVALLRLYTKYTHMNTYKYYQNHKFSNHMYT